MVEGYIRVKGGKIWYWMTGENNENIPLLLLHGGPGASHCYLAPLEALAENRPVIFYDQLGCGRSDRPKDRTLWTIERFVEELETVRIKLNLKKLHILGQSWGAMLAVDYMLTRRPEGVSSLILSAPCLSSSRWQNDCKQYISKMNEKDRKTITDSEATGQYDSEEYKNAMNAFYKKHLCRIDPWPECIIKTFDNMGTDVYEYMWGPSEFTITGTLKKYERAERLKEINTPTLFTCGRHDEASPESTEYYHKMMPASEFVVFEDASHMHHIEQEKQYINTIRSFLSNRFRRVGHPLTT